MKNMLRLLGFLFALAVVPASACLLTTHIGSCSGPHPISTSAIVPQSAADFNSNAVNGQTNVALKPNGGGAVGELGFPTAVTNSMWLYFEAQVDPNLTTSTNSTEFLMGPNGSGRTGITISSQNGSPTFYIQRAGVQFWNSQSSDLFTSPWSVSGTTGNYATGYYPFTATGGGPCDRYPSGVWVGGSSTVYPTDPGFNCRTTPTFPAGMAQVPGTQAQQSVVASSTTCAAGTSGQMVVTTQVPVAHGITPGMTFPLSGFVSPATSLNTTFTATGATNGTTLVGTAAGTCPSPIVDTAAKAFTGTGATINFSAISATNPFTTGATGITTRAAQKICGVVGVYGDESTAGPNAFPGAAFAAFSDDRGVSLGGSPALVPNLNQGTAAWSATLTSGSAVAAITPTANAVSTWAYSGTTGYVTFNMGAAIGYVPGSEFTITGGGGVNGVTYVAVNPSGLTTSAYQTGSTVWGNPLTGPNGVPQANNPGASGSGGSMASVVVPGMTLLSAPTAAFILPFPPAQTGQGGAGNYAISASQGTSGSSPFGYQGHYYTAVAGGLGGPATVTLKSQATLGDFWPLIGSSHSTSGPGNSGWGGSIGNVAVLYGKFPQTTGGAPDTAQLASLCKKTMDIQTFAAAQTVASNPTTVHSHGRFNDPGMWGDSGEWRGSAYIAFLTTTTGTLNVLPGGEGAFATQPTTPATVISGYGVPGCPLACPTITGGSGSTFNLSWASALAANVGSIGSPVTMSAGTYKPYQPLTNNLVNGYIDGDGITTTPTLHVTSIPTASPNSTFGATTGNTFTATLNNGATTPGTGHTLTVTLPAAPALDEGYAPIGVGSTIITPGGNMTVTAAFPSVNPDTGVVLTGAGWAGTYALSGTSQNLTSQVMFSTGKLPAAASQLLITSAPTVTLAAGMDVTDGNSQITGPPIQILGSGSAVNGVATWNINPTYYNFTNDTALFATLSALTPNQYLQTTNVPSPTNGLGINTGVKIIGYAPGFNANVFPQAYLLSNASANGVGKPVGTGAGPVPINGTGIGDSGAVIPGPALTIRDPGPGVNFPVDYPISCTSFGNCTATGTVKVSGTFDTSLLGGKPTKLQGQVSLTPLGLPVSGCSACAWTNLTNYTATLSSGTVWDWSGTLVGIKATGAPLFVSVCASPATPACTTNNGTAYATTPSAIKIGVPVDITGEGEVLAWHSFQSGGVVSVFNGQWGVNHPQGQNNQSAFFTGPVVAGTFAPAQTTMVAGDAFGVTGNGAGQLLTEGVYYYEQLLANATGGLPTTVAEQTRDAIGSQPKTLGGTQQVQTIGVGDGSTLTWCSAAKFCSNVSGAGPLYANFAQQTGATIAGATITTGTPATITIPTGNQNFNIPNTSGLVFGGLQPGMVLSGLTGPITLAYCQSGCTFSAYQPIFSVTHSTQQVWALSGCTTSCPSAPASLRIEPAAVAAPWAAYNYQGIFGLTQGTGNPLTSQMIGVGTLTISVNGAIVCQDTAAFQWNVMGGVCTDTGGGVVASDWVNYQTGDYVVTFAGAHVPGSGAPILATWNNLMSVSGSATPTTDRTQELDTFGNGSSTSGNISSSFAKTPGGMALHIDGGDIADQSSAAQSGYPVGAAGLTQYRSHYYNTRIPGLIPGQNASTPVASVQAWRAPGVANFLTESTFDAQLFGQWGIDFATKANFSASIGASTGTASAVLTLAGTSSGPFWEGTVVDCVTVSGGCTVGPSSGIYITGLCTTALCGADSPAGWFASGSTYALANASGITSTGAMQNALQYQGPGPAIFSGPVNDVPAQGTQVLNGGISPHMTNGPFAGGRIGRRWACQQWAGLAGDPTLCSNPTLSRANAVTGTSSPAFDYGGNYPANATGTVALVNGVSVVTFSSGLAAHARPFVVGHYITCAGCTPQVVQSVSLPPTQDTAHTNAGQVGNTFTITLGGALGVTGSKAITGDCHATSGSGGSNCIDFVFQAGTTKGTFATPFALATCGENNLMGSAPPGAGYSGKCQDNGKGSLVRGFRIGTAQSMWNGIQIGTPGAGFIPGSPYDDGADPGTLGGPFNQSGAFTCNIVDTVVVQCVKGAAYSSGIFSGLGKWTSGSTFAEYGDSFVSASRYSGVVGYVGGQPFPFTAGSGGTNGQTTVTSSTFTVTGAVWNSGTQQTTFTLSASPSAAALSAGSTFTVAGALPAAFNGSFSAVSVSGATVVAAQLTTPGTYTSGGTLSTCMTGTSPVQPKMDITIASGAIVDVYPTATSATQAMGQGIGPGCQFIPGSGTGAVTPLVFIPLDGQGGIASFANDANSIGDQLYDNTGESGNPLNPFFTNNVGGYFEPGNALTPFGGFMGVAVSN